MLFDNEENGGNKSQIRERSGSVKSQSKLVAFLYLLMRDRLCTSDIEETVIQVSAFEKESSVFQFSNGWLAQYAMDIAERLERGKEQQ